MSPVLLYSIKVFQFIGYFSLSFSRSFQRRSLIERLLSGWALCWLLSFGIMAMYALVHIEKILYLENAFSDFNDILKLVMAQLAIIVAYFESFGRREALRSFWHQHAALKENTSLSTRFSWRPHCRYLGTVAIIIATEVSALLLFIKLQRNKVENMVLFLFIYTPYSIVTHLRNVQFILHMDIIRLELLKLQHSMELFVNYAKNVNEVAAFTGDLKELLRLQLVEKQLAYQRIYEMFENFQKAFGFSIIAVMLMVYIRILVDSYFTYYSYYVDEVQAESFLLLPAIVQIPAFLLTSKSCMDVVKHITFQLHNIERPANTNALSVQIQNFSLQILHQKIKIDAVGITTMDAYMLTRIAGSLTTYMIFFIQLMPTFKNASA